MADSESGKIFVGGISWETTTATLTDYFSRYGDVSFSIVAKDHETGNPRGFAFVTFSDPSSALKALNDHHEIDGKTVEVKVAKPKQVQYHNHYQQSNGESGYRTKKIFVGGLSANVTEEVFKNYFDKFGRVTDVVVMYDNMTNRPRGFGFITFDSEDVVERITSNSFHVLDGKYVEVKRAIPKEVSRNHASSSNGGGAVYGAGGYPHESYWPENGYHGYYPSYGGVYGAGYQMPGPHYSPFGYGYGYPMVGYGHFSQGPPVNPMSHVSGTGWPSYGADNGTWFRRSELGGGSNYDLQRSQNLESDERNQ